MHIKKRKIDFNIFKNTIDYLINKYGIREISLSGGEPLLHPDLFKMIKYCKSKDIRVVLFTSGIKIQKPLTKKEKEDIETNLRNYYSSYLKEGMSQNQFENLIRKLMENYIRINNIPFTNRRI